MNARPPSPFRLLRASALARRLGYSRATIYRWWDEGFAPFVLDPRGRRCMTEKGFRAWFAATFEGGDDDSSA